MIAIKGKLYVCPTPIGNLEDITLRVLRTLKEVDLVAAEDTRHTRKLMAHYDIPTQVISFHQHSTQGQAAKLVNHMLGGKCIALVSDAGTPGISDPGQALVSACIASGIEVDPLPGPCAAITAASASGFPLAAFTFKGFLPRTGLDKAVAAMSAVEHPVLLYESPRRILRLLESMHNCMPQREVMLARELTKVHQQIMWGTPSYLMERISLENLERGEFTVILGPWEKTKDFDSQTLYFLSLQYISEGMSVKDAAARVSKEKGVSRREVYNLINKKKDT